MSRERPKMGDVVRIIECRPLSKLKHWRLGEVVRRAAQLAAQPKDLRQRLRKDLATNEHE